MRTRLTALVAATALVGLTGCGTDLSPSVHPGAAAVVGGTTISLEEVDELALDLCSVERDARAQAGEPEALGFYRALAVENLAGYEAARQYAEEHELAPGPEFESGLIGIEQQLRARQAPPDVIAVYVGFERRRNYRDAVLAATGDPQGAQADFAAWVEEIGPEVDPRFGSVDLTTGDYTAPEGLAVRVTELDPEAVAGLPADQRCG